MSAPGVRRPASAVLCVVVRDGRLLLVRRANPPDAGLWGYPGGHIEWGETSAEAAVRELAEETGVAAEAEGVIDALDAVDRVGAEVRFHHVMVVVRCRWLAGDGVAADDALEAGWFTLDEILARSDRLSPQVDTLARRVLAG